MKNWLIKKLGGYADLDSAIDAIKSSNDLGRKNKLLTEAVKRLFNTIDADDVLKITADGWMFQDRKLSELETSELKQQAIQLTGMKLWRVLRMDIKYQLNKKMFEESNITTDLLWGKLMLFYDDIIRTRLRKIREG